MARITATLILSLLLVPCTLFAQKITLTGRVIDPQGNALPNAVVQVLRDGQVLTQTTSGPDGRFLVTPQGPGEFVISTEAEGFRTVDRPIVVHANDNPAIEIQLTQ